MKRKIAPRGTLGLAHNRPLCASIIDRQIDSPSPNRTVSWCKKLRTHGQEPLSALVMPIRLVLSIALNESFNGDGIVVSYLTMSAEQRRQS
jgi:hypothetical protein